MVKLILIPAAQTEWRAQGRFSGDADLPLNEIGHRQATADAQAVAELHPEAIYCGTEQAARQTASIIAHELHLRVRTEKDLRELDLGHWEGLTTEDLRDRFGKVYRQWRQEPMSVEPPDGEAVSEAAGRLTERVRKIVKRHESEVLALVLGQFAVAILRCELDDRSYEKFWDHVDSDERCHAFDWVESAVKPLTQQEDRQPPDEYVMGNPLGWVDPLGLDGEEPPAGGGGGSGGGEGKKECKEKDKQKPPPAKEVDLFEKLVEICNDECTSQSKKNNSDQKAFDGCMTACKKEAKKIVDAVKAEIRRANKHGRSPNCTIWSSRLRWLLKGMKLTYFKFDAVNLVKMKTGMTGHVMFGIKGASRNDKANVNDAKDKIVGNGTYPIWDVLLDLCVWNTNQKDDGTADSRLYAVDGENRPISGLGQHKDSIFRPLGPHFKEQPGEDDEINGPFPDRFPQ